MAETPQLENGYTQIANEIMDAFASNRIPGEQMQCLMVIIRRTYGYHLKESEISNGEFAAATGLKKPSICRAINCLIVKNIVSKKANSNKTTYRFNKNYTSWKLLAKKLTVSKKANGCLQKSEQSLAKKLTTPIKDKRKLKDNGKNFIPPEIEDVITYFSENGYSQESARKAFKYYSEAEPPWTDSKGSKVKNWKQKMIGVWFKPENRNGKSGNRIQDQNLEAARRFLERDDNEQTG